jgi:hypothetical protein
MRFLATLSPGATVIAADYFGPIVRGQLGIVTGCRRGTWLPWQRTAYVCTFLGVLSQISLGCEFNPAPGAV